MTTTDPDAWAVGCLTHQVVHLAASHHLLGAFHCTDGQVVTPDGCASSDPITTAAPWPGPDAPPPDGWTVCPRCLARATGTVPAQPDDTPGRTRGVHTG